MDQYSQVVIQPQVTMTTTSACNCNNNANVQGYYNFIVGGTMNCNNDVNMASNCQINNGGAVYANSGTTFTLASNSYLNVVAGGILGGAGTLNILGISIGLNLGGGGGGCLLGICLSDNPNQDTVTPMNREWWTPARIAGVTVGATVALALVVVLAALLCRAHRNRQKQQAQNASETPARFEAVPVQESQQQPERQEHIAVAVQTAHH